ncbi:MAG: tyrosine-type recombinase/integrase, partial [Oscillospiraceae bacterium]|nr:tyrosine-type recombinase/integrase [Oscillospiraceae bacterium]
MPKRQKSGLYRSHVKIGVDANGKPILKYISGRTKAELERARREVVARYITGDAPVGDQVFGAYARKWFAALKSSGLSASSVESYRTALNRDILPVLGDINLRAIRVSDLQAIMAAQAGKSATKITCVRAALRRILDAACADRIISTNPMDHITTPKAAPPAEKRALTEDERAALMRVCRSHEKGAYLAAMYYLGARPGEVRGLQWGDVDFDALTVRVRRDIDYHAGGTVGALKNRRSYRTVPMPEALAEILRPLRGLPGAWCFPGEKGGPLPKDSAERLWVDLMIAAGMAHPARPNGYAAWDVRSSWAPDITPHALRHNYITMCWEAGLDPYTTMRLVGHSSIKTTMDIYTHLSDAQAAAAADRVQD